MSRKMMWGVLVIGLVLIIAPFAMGLPGKSADGEKMIDAFAPIMEEQNVQQTADYYYDVFVPLGDVAPAMSQENIDTFNGYLGGIGAMGTEAQNLGPAFADATGMTQEQVGEYMGTEFPAMTQMMAVPELLRALTSHLTSSFRELSTSPCSSTTCRNGPRTTVVNNGASAGSSRGAKTK